MKVRNLIVVCDGVSGAPHKVRWSLAAHSGSIPPLASNLRKGKLTLVDHLYTMVLVQYTYTLRHTVAVRNVYSIQNLQATVAS